MREHDDRMPLAPSVHVLPDFIPILIGSCPGSTMAWSSNPVGGIMLRRRKRFAKGESLEHLGLLDRHFSPMCVMESCHSEHFDTAPPVLGRP